MTDGATTLRTESPSVVEWISGEQPEDHADQFACCQHQRAFMLVVNGSFELSGVKRVKFRVAHTNPASRFDQVIPQIGIARPRERQVARKTIAESAMVQWPLKKSSGKSCCNGCTQSAFHV